MTTVRDVMTEAVLFRTLVVNDDFTVAGIVAPTDILSALVKGLDLREPPSSETPPVFVDLGKDPREDGDPHPR